jgi:hypothetical protein
VLVILSGDPHPVHSSTVYRAFVLCMASLCGDPHCAQSASIWRFHYAQGGSYGALSRCVLTGLYGQPLMY